MGYINTGSNGFNGATGSMGRYSHMGDGSPYQKIDFDQMDDEGSKAPGASMAEQAKAADYHDIFRNIQAMRDAEYDKRKEIVSEFDGFGGSAGLESLQVITRAKFGQPGVDAITNYPHLVKAVIDSTLYLKEEGTARPAATFSIHKLSDDSVVKAGVSGREVVMGSGCSGAFDPATGFPCGVIFSPSEPGMSETTMLIVAGVAAVALVGAFFAFKS